MAQENPPEDHTTITIFGITRSEKQDFFSKLNSFSFLTVKKKNGTPIFGIPAWPVFAALILFFVIKSIRSRRS